MSDKDTVVTSTELSSDEAFESASKGKRIHQYFTLYFIAILFIFTLSFSLSLVYFNQQNKQAQAVINEKLAPLQAQFLQQVYLIKANKLIDEILHNFDAHQFITLQQNLSLQSKKLSLLVSPHQSSYQQWFVDNDAATNLLTRIESSHSRNKTLKNNSLIQLDTLLDAIEIQLKKHDIDSNTAGLLREVQSHLVTIVSMLQRLNLQTSLGAFEQLRVHIDEMFVVDYAKMLANQQNNSLAIDEIVRDFIRFEDLVLKRGLLAKWQGQLGLMDGYQQQLIAEQQQLQSILDSLSENSEGNDTLMRTDSNANNQVLAQPSLPIWLWLSILLSLIAVVVVLLLIRARIKLASQFGVEYIGYALEGTDISEVNFETGRLITQQRKAFYCAESWQLLQKIQQLNDSRYTEAEYLVLIEKNHVLSDQISRDETKQAQLSLELELVEFNASAKSKSHLLLEQQRCKNLHFAAIKQLVLLGCSGVVDSMNTKGASDLTNEDNYLYHAHIQGRDLVRKLRQASCYRYLQSSDAVLTLNDVNLVSQIQALLLNLENKFSQSSNTVSISFDKQMLVNTNVDVELFSELFRSFIQLLISQQSHKELVLHLQLIDKNSGQQKICFSGEVKSEDKLIQLPDILQSFNEASNEQSELGEYFNTLLEYQHGDDAFANITEQGYQLSFTLPLAVSDDLAQESNQSMKLPEYLPALQVVTEQLGTQYKAMPIEVLLAVKAPRQYQRIQHLLKAMGLQVTFATSEPVLQKYWHSGRFALLITEITCKPYISFMIDEMLTSQEKIALPRGVFTLDNALSLNDEENECSHWLQGNLTSDSSIDLLVSALAPWINKQVDSVTLLDSGKATNRTLSHNDDGLLPAETNNNSSVVEINNAQSFNFERYIKHQGSADLALFMLEEYTTENVVLVDRLSEAFTVNNIVDANIAIEALMINGKILAAGDLLQVCQQWQKLIKAQELDSSDKLQINLLDKTHETIKAINQHAESIA